MLPLNVADAYPSMPKNASNITELLVSYSRGNDKALEELLPHIYAHLRKLAHIYMSKENPAHTLQPTAVVHEAFIRLVEGKSVDWQNRTHFFAVAATVMRRIIVDYARAKKAGKRGGGAIRISFDEKIHVAGAECPDPLVLDEALEKLSKVDERLSRVVELRYFGGLNVSETALALNISVATVKRDWATAKLWLYRELNHQKENA